MFLDRKKWKGVWARVKAFDYSDLGFLYLACLFTIALVYSIFRASQYYLNEQEMRAIQTVKYIGQQRELVSELERLVAFAQNRTAPQYPVTVKLLNDTYLELQRNHAARAESLNALVAACRNRPCEDIFQSSLFSLDAVDLRERLRGNGLSLASHNQLLQQLFEIAIRYHLALKDMAALAYRQIEMKNENSMTFEVIAYFSLIMLLLVQAVYVFRPAIRRLNASLSMRSDFLSRISHEIRNPMNSIIGMADILKSTKLNYEQQQYVGNLIRSGNALLDMLSNLIDSAAIERGRLTLKESSFELYRSVDRCLNLVAIAAHHKNVNLYLNMDPRIPNRLIGDSVRLEQVLVNLLSNAVKFTEQGHVKLEIDAPFDDEDRIVLRFSIADTGIGIRPEQIYEIFESFVQGDSSIKRKYGGSGLGLSISSELIRMMGGELKVTSEYGQGSEFHFEVTLRKQPWRETDDRTPLAALGSKNFIFLVSHAEAAAYRALLSRIGAGFTILHSSQEFRAHLAATPLNGEILIDDSIGIISMITCRNLAEENGGGVRVTALIRSNFTKENMDLLKKNGFRHYLIKPLKPWELLSAPATMKTEGPPIPHAPQNDAVARIRQRGLRVLLVDDSNDNLFLLKELVNPMASSVHFAENGLEALEKMRANSYDVVFMDIQMPVMDGYTAIRKIRSEEPRNARPVPIYAVTAHAGLVDAQKCREAGFTDRLVKPVVRSDIQQTLLNAFATEAGESARDGEDGSPLPAHYMQKLMPAFLSTRAADIQALERAIARDDFESARKLGHKIKGSSASYGFGMASDLARDLENAARSRDKNRCRDLTARLDDLFQNEARRLDI